MNRRDVLVGVVLALTAPTLTVPTLDPVQPLRRVKVFRPTAEHVPESLEELSTLWDLATEASFDSIRKGDFLTLEDVGVGDPIETGNTLYLAGTDAEPGPSGPEFTGNAVLHRARVGGRWEYMHAAGV